MKSDKTNESYCTAVLKEYSLVRQRLNDSGKIYNQIAAWGAGLLGASVWFGFSVGSVALAWSEVKPQVILGLLVFPPLILMIVFYFVQVNVSEALQDTLYLIWLEKKCANLLRLSTEESDQLRKYAEQFVADYHVHRCDILALLTPIGHEHWLWMGRRRHPWPQLYWLEKGASFAVPVVGSFFGIGFLYYNSLWTPLYVYGLIMLIVSATYYLLVSWYVVRMGLLVESRDSN